MKNKSASLIIVIPDILIYYSERSVPQLIITVWQILFPVKTLPILSSENRMGWLRSTFMPYLP